MNQIEKSMSGQNIYNIIAFMTIFPTSLYQLTVKSRCCPDTKKLLSKGMPESDISALAKSKNGPVLKNCIKKMKMRMSLDS
jgi:hypothetical protein